VSRRAFEIDDDELCPTGGLVDPVDAAVLGDDRDQVDAGGWGAEPGPLGDPELGIGIEDGDRRAPCGERGGEEKRGGGIVRPSLGIGEGDDRHGGSCLLGLLFSFRRRKSLGAPVAVG